MKITIQLIIICLIFFKSNAQEVTKEYYDNGQLKSIGKGKKPGTPITLNPKQEAPAEGEWKFYYENGKLERIGHYKGLYKIGLWKYYYENGKLKTEGRWEMESDFFNKMVGVWKEYDKNGNLNTEGSYSYDIIKGDLKDGEWKFYYENGQLESSGKYSDGKKDGDWKQYYHSGELKSTGKYSDGKKDGYWKEYYKSGELDSTGKYLKGDKAGTWKQYYTSGQLKFITDYSLNSISYIAYYENGNKSEEAFLRKKDKKYGSELDGPFKQYYENGNLKVLVNFEYGTEVGIYKSYDKNGNLESEGDYDLVNGSKYLSEPDGKNYAKAKELLLKSAKRGNDQAEYYLGYMYHAGMGVSINHEIAREWYSKSCDKNNYDACVNIGILFLSKERAIVEEINSLGTTESDNKRSDELARNRLEIIKKALPFFEKAYSIDSSKEEIKNTITNIKNELNNK